MVFTTGTLCTWYMHSLILSPLFYTHALSILLVSLALLEVPEPVSSNGHHAQWDPGQLRFNFTQDTWSTASKQRTHNNFVGPWFPFIIRLPFTITFTRQLKLWLLGNGHTLRDNNTIGIFSISLLKCVLTFSKVEANKTHKQGVLNRPNDREKLQSKLGCTIPKLTLKQNTYSFIHMHQG